MNPTEERLDGIAWRREDALRQLVRLRHQTLDAAEFGRLAVPILDSMVAYIRAANCKHNKGSWDDEERAILREAYKYSTTESDAIEAAGLKLARTKSQIRAMAANMRRRGCLR